MTPGHQISNYILGRYHVEEAETPAERMQSDGGAASYLLVHTFQLVKEINEWLSQETSEDR
jgi:hypothetical protein